MPFAPIFNHQGSEHAEQLQTLVSGTSKSSALRLTVDLNALRRMDPLETQAVIRRPMHYMSAFQEAAAEVIHSLDSSLGPPFCFAHQFLYSS